MSRLLGTPASGAEEMLRLRRSGVETEAAESSPLVWNI
jgi:hypothetical protein